MKRTLSILISWAGFAFLFLGVGANAQQILWERDGMGDSSRFGKAIRPMGDQNLDGFDDFMVQSFGVGPQGTPNEDHVEFFHGGDPPSTTPYLIVGTPPDALGFRDVWTMDFNGDGFTDWFLEGDPFRIFFGGPDMDSVPDVVWPGQRPENQVAFGTIGDYNGDGCDDFYRYDQPSGGGDSTEIFWGGMPFDTIPDLVFHSPPDLIGKANPDTYGDVNGDGIDDFVAATFPSGQTQVFIFHGSTNPDTIPDQVLHVPGWNVEVHLVPDLNNDGKDDLVMYGGSDGIMVFFGSDSMLSTPNYVLSWGTLDEARRYGRVCGSGDTNGDGFNDLTIADSNTPGGGGAADHWLGYSWMNPNPVWTIWGGSGPYNLIGIRSAAGVGDINNDGFDDVALGAWHSDFDMRGRVVVIAGEARQVPTANRPHEMPNKLDLHAFPNPFNARTTVELSLPSGGATVTLSLFNVLGEQVLRESLRASSRNLKYSLDGALLKSGVYFLRADAGSFENTVKLLLVK